LAVAGIVVAVVALFPAIRGPVVEKLTLQDLSGQVRIAQWQETAAYLKDGHWLVGAGLSGYPIAIKPYHVHPEYEIFQDPHNVALNVWVELGALGLVAVALLAWQALRAPKRDWVALAASFALLQMLVHGLVDVPFFKNDLAMMTFLLLALVAAEVKPRQG
jgi:O-antigen ligase